MKKQFFKSIAALSIMSVLVAATPATAGGWGWRGGWGGWRGGWGYHHHHGGYWGGGAAAAGLLGGLAVGAIAAGAAQQPYYGYGGYGYGYGYPGYQPCYWANQPVLDDWGQVVAYQRVQVCN